MRDLAVKVEARLQRPGCLSRRRCAGNQGGKKTALDFWSRAVRSHVSVLLPAECIERLFHGFTDTGKDRRIA